MSSTSKIATATLSLPITLACFVFFITLSSHLFHLFNQSGKKSRLLWAALATFIPFSWKCVFFYQTDKPWVAVLAQEFLSWLPILPFPLMLMDMPWVYISLHSRGKVWVLDLGFMVDIGKAHIWSALVLSNWGLPVRRRKGLLCIALPNSLMFCIRLLS